MPPSNSLLLRTATEVLAASGGVAHLQRFLAAGLTRRQVSHLQLSGALIRPRIGWYLDPASPPDALAAVRVGGALGCVSAAQHHGIATPEGHHHTTHVSLDPAATRLRRSDDPAKRAFAGDDPSVRWHWDRRIEPVHGWSVGRLDSLVQMAGCTNLYWLTAAVDSVRCATYHRPLIDDAVLARLGPGTPALLQQAILRSDPRSESVGETFIRLGLQDAGVPVEPQVRLTERFRGDLFVDDWLPIESDGLKFHGVDAIEGDRERDATLAWLHRAPLRFTQNQAVRQLPFVVDTIRRVWLRGPGEPAPRSLL